MRLNKILIIFVIAFFFLKALWPLPVFGDKKPTVSVSDASELPGAVFSMPIEIAEITDNIISIQVALTYDQNILTAIDVATSELTEMWLMDYNIDIPGQIIIGLIGMDFLSSEGIVANINFQVNPEAIPGQASALALTEALVGDLLLGESPAKTTDGQFTVLSPADTAPPAAIANLSVFNIATTTIALTWTAPGDDENTGTAAQYDIRYLTSDINEQKWNNGIQVDDEPLPQAAGSQETHTIKALSPNTYYWFAVKTLDEAGNVSELSNVVREKTAKEKVNKFKIKINFWGKNTHQSNLQLQTLSPDTNDLIGSVLEGRTDELGEDEFEPIDLEEDYYDLRIIIPYHLSKKSKGVFLSSNTEIDFGTVMAGNLQEDNEINEMDWAVMRDSWGTDNQMADINQDALVNSIDWSFININWGAVGE